MRTLPRLMGQTEREHLIDNSGSKASHITMGSFASRPANTFTLLLSTDAPYDSSNKENFIEPEHDVVDPVSTSIRPPTPRILLWIGLLNAGLLLAGLITLWTMSFHNATRLQELILTEDGKSFPFRHLTWSQEFQPLPCGRTPAEALQRMPLRYYSHSMATRALHRSRLDEQIQIFLPVAIL